MLSAVSYMIQGLEQLPGQALFVYFKNHLHLNPSQIMYIGSFVGIAWLLKVFTGIILDSFLTKKIWYIIALILSIGASCILGVYSLPLVGLVLMLIIASTMASIRDVAVDGLAVVEGQENGNCGQIQGIQWVSITLATMFIGLCGGYIAQNLSYKFAYLCLVPIYLVAGVVIYFYKEKPKEPLDLKKYVRLWKDKRFLWAALFLFLYSYSPSFSTVLSFIQRDNFGWSEIFIGRLVAALGVCEIIGALIFFKLSKTINLRKWLVRSVYIGAIITLCFLYYTPATALIYGLVFAIVAMFIHLIVLTFMAQIAIKGCEATSFALLCAIKNLSSTASSLSGAWLFPKIGLHPLIIIAALTSFLCLPLIKKLEMPNES